MPIKPNPRASFDYDVAKNKAIDALKSMTTAMKEMGAEHVNFHNHFDNDVQKQLQDMRRSYGGEELNVEVIRSTALDRYISPGNLPKVTAFGHLQVEQVLKDFQRQEKDLDEMQRKTATLVESLLGDRRCVCGDGHGARA